MKRGLFGCTMTPGASPLPWRQPRAWHATLIVSFKAAFIVAYNPLHTLLQLFKALTNLPKSACADLHVAE